MGDVSDIKLIRTDYYTLTLIKFINKNIIQNTDTRASSLFYRHDIIYSECVRE